MTNRGKSLISVLLTCFFIFQPFLTVISEANIRQTITAIPRTSHSEIASRFIDPPEITVSLTRTKSLTDRSLSGIPSDATQSSLLSSDSRSISPEKEAKVREMLGKTPLQFIENKGQVDEKVRYYAKKAGTTIYFTDDEIVFDFMRPKKSADDHKTKGGKHFSPHKFDRLGKFAHEKREFERQVVRMKVKGANLNPVVTGIDKQETSFNYFKGNDPSKWRTNVSAYSEVYYKDIYAGIDLRFYAKNDNMEYDFIVKPGADPRTIAVAFEGIDGMDIDGRGDLIIKTAFGEMRQKAPHIFQVVDGQTVEVEGGFKIVKAVTSPAARKAIEYSGEAFSTYFYTFNFAAYDKRSTLIIDPSVIYSTYLGGSGDYESGRGIAVDIDGNAYVTGDTPSTDFPLVNAKYPNFAGGYGDAFVFKINSSGSQVIYSTYLGGGGVDGGNDIAVDGAGNAYLTGYTDSSDFPLVNAKYSNYGGGTYDAFVFKINSSGSQVIYSTYLGGSDVEGDSGIAVDSAGNAYVTGYTYSYDFPMVNAKYPNFVGGLSDVYVFKINSTGSQVIYSTYLGGSDNDWSGGIAVDSAGNAYVTGYTYSSDFPMVNAKYPNLSGVSDAFMFKINSSGSQVVYSTFFGGSDSDGCRDIAVDGAGNAYVTGDTYSYDFPTVNAKYPNLSGVSDAFIFKINSSGSQVVYSTYLGGSNDDTGYGLAVDGSGNAYVTGATSSSDFPMVNAKYPNFGVGYWDAFVFKINSTGSQVVYSTYLGGSNDEWGSGIAVDGAGNAYVTGDTGSSDFPMVNAKYPNFGGGYYDAFIIKISDSGTSTQTIAQGPTTGSPGKVFVQWGNGFSPNSAATLHFKKPDGTQYPTTQQQINAAGHFEISYTIPANRPAGTYTWWAIDGPTGKKSNVVSYQITADSDVGTVHGTLHHNSATGPVLAGAKVTCGTRTTTTAVNGTFSLSGIPVGGQVLSFSKTGYQPFSVSVNIPESGSVSVGDRWLLQNGLVNPTIAQSPMSGPPGTTFTQWGTGFTPANTATLHFKKPDGSQYPTVSVKLDGAGHFEIPYRTPMNKPAGTYTWWAIDDVTKKKSNEVSYKVIEPVDTCNAPQTHDALMKVTPTCRDSWNMEIYYAEVYNSTMKLSQQLIMDKIDGVLTANTMANAAIDAFSSMRSLYKTPQLAHKDFYHMFGVGASESLAFEANVLGNGYAKIWFGAFGAAAQTLLEGGNPKPVVEYGIKTGAGTISNLLTTIGVTTLTKRFQEVEIAKTFLLGFYEYGSRMSLLANSYGLPANASMLEIIKAVAKRIGAENPWYWFDNYDINRVVDHVVTNMNVVGIKQAEYSK